MAHDPELAHRIRTALSGKPGITEKTMFGGIGFLLDGNLLVTASGRGGMLVRVGPEGHAAAVASPHVTAMVMGGRGMIGYVNVAAEGVITQAAVASWIERAWKHVRTLAPKQGARGKRNVVKAAPRATRAPRAKPPAKAPARPSRSTPRRTSR
jgi:TfoX/Sxy family transcriptional regulator of competence genes